MCSVLDWKHVQTLFLPQNNKGYSGIRMSNGEQRMNAPACCTPAFSHIRDKLLYSFSFC